MESYDILTMVENGAGHAVLATVIYVEGHAYRKQGAVMLLMDDGRSVGSISPGCLEADLAVYRSVVWESGKPQMVEYDMRPAEDLGWGETIGCGGLLRILLEPVAGKLLECLLAIKASLDHGEPVELLRTFSDTYAVMTYEVCTAVNLASNERLTDLSTYTSLFAPKPRVVVFGANEDAIPLAQMALSAGFRVVVADWRDSLCTRERFPGAEIEVAFPGELICSLKLTDQDYVVVMSHQFQKDMVFVQGMMVSPLRYLGIMGSRERTEKMLEGLERPDWLHYPVGLSIGSEGPFENAVSIVAQLIAIRRGALESGEQCSVAKRGDIHGLGSW
ncbi:XdhC family protein [Paenibacillus sp. GCM10027628]|uniref:XdhC family protein n=1 Tax=Paenibacillus sp. GCM10027628 TaxID=3273413 RepID=UPI00362DDDC3